MKIKRILAYLIDSFIVMILATLLFSLCFKNSYNNYLDTSLEYFDELEKIEYSGSGDEDLSTLNELLYKTNKSAESLLVLKIGITFIYFGIIAYLLKGQTLGKKIFKIKVVSVDKKELNPSLFILRSVILTNLIPQIISLLVLMFASQSTWEVITNYIGYLEYIIIFIIIGFVIFRDDERGLHDLIAHTKVISTKESKE